MTTETGQTSATAYHWVMTVQTNDGRQGTTDGVVDVTPGIDTQQSTYTEVLRAVKQWVGTENVTVLFYTAAPNQL